MVGLKAENAFPPWLAQSSSLHRPRPLPIVSWVFSHQLTKCPTDMATDQADGSNSQSFLPRCVKMTNELPVTESKDSSRLASGEIFTTHLCCVVFKVWLFQTFKKSRS